MTNKQTPATPSAATASLKAQEGSQNAAAVGGAPQVPATVSSGSGSLALPSDLLARLNAEAKDVAAKERPAISKIGLRNGIMTYQQQEIKNNTLDCVVLVAIHRNAYYDQPFDPNNIRNPVCFALSIDGENMEAHENVPEDNVPEDDPEKERTSSRSCEGCAMNAWGSDPRPSSRGKACKETRRLVLLPSSALESAEDVLKAELAVMDIPVTSGRNYSAFVNSVAAQANVPPWAAVCTISIERDAKTQFKVIFEPKAIVPTADLILALERRLPEALRVAMTPYDEVSSVGGTMTDGTGVGTKATPATAAAKKPKF